MIERNEEKSLIKNGDVHHDDGQCTDGHFDEDLSNYVLVLLPLRTKLNQQSNFGT